MKRRAFLFVLLTLTGVVRAASAQELERGIDNCPDIPLQWRCCVVPPDPNQGSNDIATQLCNGALSIAQGLPPAAPPGMSCSGADGQAVPAAEAKCPREGGSCLHCDKNKKFVDWICKGKRDFKNNSLPVCSSIPPQVDDGKICVTINIGCKYDCAKP